MTVKKPALPFPLGANAMELRAKVMRREMEERLEDRYSAEIAAVMDIQLGYAPRQPRVESQLMS